jgi:WD repeat-containing protein 35
VKLEALPSIPKERREAFADLAMSIFVAHPPADLHNLAEGRERQRTAAAAGGKGQFDALLDDLVADKDQVGGLQHMLTPQELFDCALDSSKCVEQD